MNIQNTIELRRSMAGDKVEIRQYQWPQKLLVELRRQRLKYSEPLVLLSAIYLTDRIVGVYGDPQNAAYEWFIAKDDGTVEETSNQGWGCSEDAFLCGLKKAMVDI